MYLFDREGRRCPMLEKTWFHNVCPKMHKLVKPKTVSKVMFSKMFSSKIFSDEGHVLSKLCLERWSGEKLTGAMLLKSGEGICFWWPISGYYVMGAAAAVWIALLCRTRLSGHTAHTAWLLLQRNGPIKRKTSYLPPPLAAQVKQLFWGTHWIERTIVFNHQMSLWQFSNGRQRFAFLASRTHVVDIEKQIVNIQSLCLRNLQNTMHTWNPSFAILCGVRKKIMPSSCFEGNYN